MKRLLGTLLSLSLAVGATGCSMCYTPYDDTYNAFGGLVERQDMMHGRSGSILSDPNLHYEQPPPGDEATQEDLYQLEMFPPELEEIQPQPTPADQDT